MSTTTTLPASDDRPWHHSTNPFEAMFQHFTAEIAALKKAAAVAAPAPAPAAVVPPRPPVTPAPAAPAATPRPAEPGLAATPPAA